MDIEFILIILMAFLLISWVIICYISYFKQAKSYFMKNRKDVLVKCENCGLEYCISPEEFYNTYFSKTKSINKTKAKCIALANEPEYLSVSKKFNCPHCGEKHYAQIINAMQIFQENKSIVMQYSIKSLIKMAIGGLIIIIIMNIPISIAKKARLDKVEQMKQERYENFKKDYGLE